MTKTTNYATQTFPGTGNLALHDRKTGRIVAHASHLYGSHFEVTGEANGYALDGAVEFTCGDAADVWRQAFGIDADDLVTVRTLNWRNWETHHCSAEHLVDSETGRTVCGREVPSDPRVEFNNIDPHAVKHCQACRRRLYGEAAKGGRAVSSRYRESDGIREAREAREQEVAIRKAAADKQRALNAASELLGKVAARLGGIEAGCLHAPTAEVERIVRLLEQAAGEGRPAGKFGDARDHYAGA